jgi:polysaccharide export outer membrane protein
MRAFTVAALALALGVAAPAFAAQEKAEQAQPAEPSKPEAAGPVKPMTLPASVDPTTYTLGADDVLFIRVWREPDLSGTMAVRPDGKITIPLINEVQAAGLTPKVLGDHITEALSKFINNPQVMVSVQSVRSKRYYVTGEINRPGAYPLATPTTVFEALTMAGGFREFANTKHIVIIRGTQRLKFNWKDVVKGKNLGQNVLLENGDKVVVP